MVLFITLDLISMRGRQLRHLRHLIHRIQTCHQSHLRHLSWRSQTSQMSHWKLCHFQDFQEKHDEGQASLFRKCLLLSRCTCAVLAKKRKRGEEVKPIYKCLNTQYMRNSKVIYTFKMEYVSKINIFGWKMMVKSGLENINLKFLCAQSLFWKITFTYQKILKRFPN